MFNSSKFQEFSFTPITNVSESCLGQGYCGQNAVCDEEVRSCKCLPKFEVVGPVDINCGESIFFL